MKYIGVTLLLSILLVLAVAYGCCGTTEAFQTEETTPMKKSTEEAIEDVVKEKTEEAEKKETDSLLSELKAEMAKGEAEVEKANAAEKAKRKEEVEVLNKQEQELFDQITKNSIPSADLEKLVRAGMITEKMVEKFLNQIDKLNTEEKIEGFCSGQSCYASF
jgi:outer membrane biosynthesis protein TonB